MDMEKKILFVDDEKGILAILDCLFRGKGYSPRCTTSGTEALEILKRDDIKVVYTDLRMPEMDGTELCRRVRQLQPGAQVYALSAFVGSHSPEQFEAMGFAGVFTKPFNVPRLLDSCRAAFEKLEHAGKPA